MMSEVNSSAIEDSPKKGHSLSTRTSSFEALDPHDPNLSHLAGTMFEKTEDYLCGELSSIQDTYKKLEEMNHLTMSKYADLHRITSNLNTNVAQLNEMYISLTPYLQKINALEDSITQLEKMAHSVEAYSKRLEKKFNHLMKS